MVIFLKLFRLPLYTNLYNIFIFGVCFELNNFCSFFRDTPFRVPELRNALTSETVQIASLHSAATANRSIRPTVLSDLRQYCFNS
jgi:hypothetical protein